MHRGASTPAAIIRGVADGIRRSSGPNGKGIKVGTYAITSARGSRQAGTTRCIMPLRRSKRDRTERDRLLLPARRERSEA
jgi:hypothetical protein